MRTKRRSLLQTVDVEAVHVDGALLVYNRAGRRAVPAAESVPRGLAGSRCDGQLVCPGCIGSSTLPLTARVRRRAALRPAPAAVNAAHVVGEPSTDAVQWRRVFPVDHVSLDHFAAVQPHQVRVIAARRRQAAGVLEQIEKAQRARSLTESVHVDGGETISAYRRNIHRGVHGDRRNPRPHQHDLYRQRNIGRCKLDILTHLFTSLHVRLRFLFVCVFRFYRLCVLSC